MKWARLGYIWVDLDKVTSFWASSYKDKYDKTLWGIRYQIAGESEMSLFTTDCVTREEAEIKIMEIIGSLPKDQYLGQFE